MVSTIRLLRGTHVEEDVYCLQQRRCWLWRDWLLAHALTTVHLHKQLLQHGLNLIRGFLHCCLHELTDPVAVSNHLLPAVGDLLLADVPVSEEGWVWNSGAEEGCVMLLASEESSCMLLLPGPLEEEVRDASDGDRMMMEPSIVPGPSHMVTAHTHTHTVSTS